MKVAIYVRVSLEEASGKNRQFQNPENQIVPLKDFCKAMGYEIVEIYEDRMSGANPARPNFRRMMKDAMLRRFSGILVWKLDRFSREGVIPTMSYIKKLKNRGIWLRSMTESWLDTSEEGITDIVLAIMSWASHEEKKKISERTKAGIARKRAIGQWKGGRPRKITPKIEDSCEVRTDGRFQCRKCNKIFKDETTYVKKWSSHINRCEWIQNKSKEKGATKDKD